MKYKNLLPLLTLTLVSALHTRAQQISLEDVVQYRYYPRSVTGLSPLPDGISYGRFSDNGRQILRCSYATGQTLDTLLNLDQTLGADSITDLTDYDIAPDGAHILLQTQRAPIYRRSYTSVNYIYDVATHTLTPLSLAGPQECVRWAPNGQSLAFIRDNNLYLRTLTDTLEQQITHDGLYNHIINGKPDWVYEEEFEYNCAYDFSADSRTIAWVRFDETRVPTFTFQLFRGSHPTLPQYSPYPGIYSYKYPKAGEPNSLLQVKTYDIPTRTIRTHTVPLDSDGYIPRIQFTGDPDRLAVVTLNRHQDQCDIYILNPQTSHCQLLVRETADKYISTDFYKNLNLKGDRFVLLSERDGYQHLYLYNKDGSLIRQLTQGTFVVKNYYGSDPDQNNFYYASNEGSPLEQYIYKVSADGQRSCLTPPFTLGNGTNNATFSTNCQYFINTYSSITTPPITTVFDNQGKPLRELVRNDDILKAYQDQHLTTPELFTFTTTEGVQLNGWILRPADFDPAKQYPVLMYQYSGPGDQQVRNNWNLGFGIGLLWEHRLTQKGYIVACVDGRGTGGRGAEFQKSTYLTMGDLESRDQVETALYLATLPYVDPDRIAIWGWSFGGFNTIMSMCEGRPVFRCGVAVASVADWRYYDTAYTERYMRTPQENPEGYDISPLHRYQNLHGDLLICHGLADDNVHFQNTAELTEALTQANIPFQMHTYTNRNHGISGGNTRLHLFTRIEQFLDQHLLTK